jgi:hypothetical protein
MIRKTLIRRVVNPLVFLAAIVLVFEEWLWDTLKQQIHRLSRLPSVAAFEIRLRNLPPWAALLVLTFPGIILIPFKILALQLITHRPMLGLCTLLAAKLTGTAIAAYLFDLVRENARKIGWFNFLYERILKLLTTAKTWLHHHPTYTWIQKIKTHIKQQIHLPKQKPWIVRKLQNSKKRAVQFWEKLKS